MSTISFGIISEMTENPLDELSLEKRVLLMHQELTRITRLQPTPLTPDQKRGLLKRYGVDNKEGVEEHRKLMKKQISDIKEKEFEKLKELARLYAALGGVIILDPIRAIRYFINRRK